MPKLPEQSKPYSEEEAREEASKVQEKIKSGEAKDYSEAEKIIEAEKESKEKETNPFFFVYRENDLFKDYIPLMLAFLKEQGYQVNLQSFPAGTSEKEIKSWYVAHQAELQSANVFADNTTWRSSDYKLKTKINLDSLMNQATLEAITGDATFTEQLGDKVYENRDNPEKQQEAKQEYLSALGKIYKKILTSIPEEQRQKMEVVILKGLFRGNYVNPPLIAHEPFCPKDENFEELKKETNDFAGRMKEWLSEAGVSNITTFSTGAEIPSETIRKLTEGQAYIIFDRHTVTSGTNLTREGAEDLSAFWGANAMDSGLIQEKAALQTPIATFYSDVQKKIGIVADSQKVGELIKKELQSKVGEEDKNK